MAVLPVSQSAHSSNTPVPFIDLVAQHQTIAGEVRDAVDRVFASQLFVLGEEVAQFEAECAQYCDANDAISCASGTDALLLALMALGIGPGDEVVTSPFSFFATAGCIHRVGARPVFVDIDPVSMNIDPDQIARAITSKTRAILPVHLFGQCTQMEPLWRIAVQHGLTIIEDACQSIGAEYRGRRAGVLGTIGCFSFFPTKNLGGAGDGGLMTTDDPELSRRLRLLRVHGDVGAYRHVEVGLNSRLDALQAAVLRVKLGHLGRWTEARRANAKRYPSLFEKYDLLDHVVLPRELPDCRHVYNQFTIRVKNGRRDAVLASLRSQQIGAAIYYPIPLHLQECFAFLGYKQGDLPASESAAAEVLSLPIFPELGAERQEVVVRGIARALGCLASESEETKHLRRVA
ncbi:MAG TPA: DegT/DnrJ/EryC1/StrS family aminotransferase [Planctomycetaceae bacterium]|jgi:dTDP-4-amino-4,6-dideoxygalactose transaminase|nr:DegT/DnrJ/EryC1/StrS family aminotransferase [Planctomycetaceae bacterium]